MTETTTQAPPPRLKVRYREEIRDQLRDEFSFGNVMQVPGLTTVSYTHLTLPTIYSV